MKDGVMDTCCRVARWYVVKAHDRIEMLAFLPADRNWRGFKEEILSECMNFDGDRPYPKISHWFCTDLTWVLLEGWKLVVRPRGRVQTTPRPIPRGLDTARTVHYVTLSSHSTTPTPTSSRGSSTRAIEVIPVASWTTRRRHPRDDPRENVGVGVVEFELYRPYCPSNNGCTCRCWTQRSSLWVWRAEGDEVGNVRRRTSLDGDLVYQHRDLELELETELDQ